MSGTCACQARMQSAQGETNPRRQERNTLLLHGTTLGLANKIRSQQAMAQQITYFALGWANRDLARIFAVRASLRRPHDGGPAIVLASVPEQLIERLRGQRLMKPAPFDPQDRPELRSRMQWIVEPGGMELINRGAESFAAVPVRRSP